MTLFPIVVTLLLLGSVENKRILRFAKFQCLPIIPERLCFARCSLNETTAHRYTVNMVAKLGMPPVNNISVSLLIKKRMRTSTHALYNMTIDICGFLKARKNFRVIRELFVIGGFEKYSNVNHTCPYDHDLILDNLVVDEKYASQWPFPSGEYFVELTWFHSALKVAVNQITAFLKDI